MILAVRTSKQHTIKNQLASSLELGARNIVTAPTKYAGITLLKLDESAVATPNSIRNIEAILLDDVVAAELVQPTTKSYSPSLNSLDKVDEREQYAHLSQLLFIQKASGVKR